MYNRGTLEEFNIWHELAKIAESIPKEGYINNLPIPDAKQTIAYSNAIQNPSGNNDYIWEYGKYPDSQKPALTIANEKDSGWFIDNG